jgi:hypothetical protein
MPTAQQFAATKANPLHSGPSTPSTFTSTRTRSYGTPMSPLIAFNALTTYAGLTPSPIPVETYHCDFCQERHPIDRTTVQLKACGHMYCKDMFQGWIEAKVKDAAIHPICFHDLGSGSQCNQPIHHDDIRAHLSPASLRKVKS